MKYPCACGLVALMVLLSATGVLAQDGAAQADDIFEDWSPDSHSLIYVSIHTDHRDLFTIDRDGQNARALTKDQIVYNADYSPDGRYIAIEHEVALNDTDLYLLNPSDGTTIALFEGAETVVDSTWSPDSSHMLIGGATHRGYDDEIDNVWLADVATGDAINISHNRLADPFFAWSPDGAYFYVAGEARDRSSPGLYLYHADGTPASDDLLRTYWYARDTCCSFNVTWTPDNQHLLVKFRLDGNLYELGLDDSGLKPLLYIGSGAGDFRATPDGSEFWYRVYNPLSSDEAAIAAPTLATGMYRFNPAEGVAQLVMPNHPAYPEIAPDWKQVVFYPAHLISERSRLTFMRLPDGAPVESDIDFISGETAAWSPDSTAFVMSVCVEQDYDVYIVDAATGKSLNLTTGDVDDNPLGTFCFAAG